MEASEPLRIAIVAGEESGDRLAGALMREVASRRAVVWAGVGGEDMGSAGLSSVFPMDEVSVMGVDAIVRRLPALLGRIEEAAKAVVAFEPDALVIVDSPEFTHRVARRVRRRRPALPVVNYVSPTVWAWRPGRARAMRAYVDEVLALFPFEPTAHTRLGGPPATYVGHPLYEAMRRVATVPERAPTGDGTLLILPGSRRAEVERLGPTFSETLARLPPVRAELLTLPHLAPLVDRIVARWPVAPKVLVGAGHKAGAFARAGAALAASGTVTFELSAARVPMVVAYKLDTVGRLVKATNRWTRLVTAPSMVLTNIAIGRNAVPAFLQEEVTAHNLAAALGPLLTDGSAERAAQMRAFDELDALMAIGRAPSEAAADRVIAHADAGRRLGR